MAPTGSRFLPRLVHFRSPSFNTSPIDVCAMLAGGAGHAVTRNALVTGPVKGAVRAVRSPVGRRVSVQVDNLLKHDR